MTNQEQWQKGFEAGVDHAKQPDSSEQRRQLDECERTADYYPWSEGYLAGWVSVRPIPVKEQSRR